MSYDGFPDWGKKILESTDGRCVDKVVEIGGEAAIQQSAACTSGGGEFEALLAAMAVREVHPVTDSVTRTATSKVVRA